MTRRTPAPPAPPGALTHRQILVVLSGLLLGMFLAALDQTIVSTAMKTIADRLDGQTVQAWVTTAYLITATVSTPLYGKLSDIYGRRRFYLFAIAVFVAGSMLCGTASSIYSLAGYRAVQGLGAGGLMSLAFVIVADLVPPRDRGRYQGYFLAVFGASSVLGPVLGGFLAGQDQLLGVAGWRWIFVVNVPVGLAALLVVAKVLHLPHRRLQHRIDYLGAALLCAGVVPLLLVAETGTDWGWTSPPVLGLVVAGLMALGGFAAWEARMGEEAILPLRLFGHDVFRLTTVATALVGAGMFGGLLCLPLYLQIVRGQSPTAAGLHTVPVMAGMLLSSRICGRLMSATGRYKRYPILGTALIGVALLLFSTLKPNTPMPLVMTYMTIMGAGLGPAVQTLVTAAQNALPAKDMGVSTAANAFARSLGGTFGAAVFLSVLFSTVGGAIQHRFTTLAYADPVGMSAAMGRLDPATRAALTATGAHGSPAALNNTDFITHLPAALQQVFRGGFADSLQPVFLLAALVVVPAFVLTWFIREIPLRTHAGLPATPADTDPSPAPVGQADAIPAVAGGR